MRMIPSGEMHTMSVDDTLVRWHAEEQEIRAKLAGATGVARDEQVRGRTGMQMFQAIFDGELPRPPIGDTLDFVPIRIEPGLAVFQGRPRAKHYNPLGTVHGGWFATLPRFGGRLRGTFDTAGGQGLHNTGAEAEHRARAYRSSARRTGRGALDPRRTAGGDRRRTPRRARRQAVCACDDDLPDLRSPL
jgi:hypothetical protein